MTITIENLMHARSGHLTRTADSGYRQDNLSDFKCSCGMYFVASSIDRLPRGTSSLMAVHTAETTLQALGLPTGRLIEDLSATVEPPAGTVIKSADGLLLQWHPGRDDTDGYFRSPEGKRINHSDVASPVTMLWSPLQKTTE